MTYSALLLDVALESFHEPSHLKGKGQVVMATSRARRDDQRAGEAIRRQHVAEARAERNAMALCEEEQRRAMAEAALREEQQRSAARNRERQDALMKLASTQVLFNERGQEIFRAQAQIVCLERKNKILADEKNDFSRQLSTELIYCASLKADLKSSQDEAMLEQNALKNEVQRLNAGWVEEKARSIALQAATPVRCIRFRANVWV